MKKLISLLLAVMLVVSTMGMTVFAKNEPVSTDYAVDTLCDLGFLIGDDAGNLQLDKPVTRAEFATILLRVLGLSEVNAPVTMQTFNDVPQTHWAAGIISHCSTLGIINGYGNGMFGPDDYVNYQDAITMVIRTLGYEPAVGNANYPTGYLTKAGELGLTNGVNGMSGTPILRKDIVRLIFNSLDVPLMTQSGYGTFTQYVVNDGYSSTTGTLNIKKTLLSEKHNIVKVQGVVGSASYLTTNKTKVDVDVVNGFRNKFGIDDRKMFVGDTDIAKYSGKEVIMFVHYDEFNDECTVKSFYEVISNDKLIIDFVDVEDVNGNEITYYVNNYKTTTVTIAEDANVYYNGVNAKDKEGNINLPTNFDMEHMSGTIELTLLDDTNAKIDYDTVFITAYDTFVVDEVRYNSKTVMPKNDTVVVKRINFDEDDDVIANLYDANGRTMDWTDLNEYDVLSVKYVKSDSEDIYEARVIDNIVVGVVEEISDDYVVINSNEYKTLVDDIKLGDEGTYYLDINDNIVYHNATITKSDNYAYVIKVANATDMDNAQMKILTKENGVVTVDVAKKITVIKNGNKTNNVKFNSIDNDLVGSVITYKLNANGEISTIEFAVANNDEEVFNNPYNDVDLTDYDVDNQSFRINSKKIYLNDNVVIFNVYGDEEDYEVISLNNFADDQVLYGVDLYDIDEDRNVSVLVLKSANTITPETFNATFITKISETIDEDGYNVYRVTGYVNGEEVTYICDDVDDSIIGTLVTPIYKANGEVNRFEAVDSVDGEYVYGILSDVNTKRKYIVVDGEEYNIKNSVNIYVYDENTNTRNKYKINEVLSYIEYDDIEEVWYANGDEISSAPSVYMYIYDGDVVDLVYYID